MKKHATEQWYQESLLPDETIKVVLEIGLRTDSPVAMLHTEVSEPGTNTLREKHLFWYRREPEGLTMLEQDMELFINKWLAMVPVNRATAATADLEPF